MPTINQLCKKKRKSKRSLNKVPALKGSPQKKGFCIKMYLLELLKNLIQHYES